MTDYDAIKRICDANSAISATFIDDFLLQFCADREKLPQAFIREFGPYEHIVRSMSMQWMEMLLAQYMAHRLFKRGGLAQKYRTHPAIRRRSAADLAFLDTQIAHPWRWCFCRIDGQPHKDFFIMEDVCTAEELLLYSPGISRLISTDGFPVITLLLIGDNGHCWQTYGALMGFNGLFPFDPLIIAQQLDPRVRELKQVPAVMEREPIPFAMLWSGGSVPAMVHHDDVIIYHQSDLRDIDLSPELLRKQFRIEREGDVVHLSLKYWNKHPHFAEAFYDEKKRHLLATVLTERGYAKLVAAFAECGVELPVTATHRGSMGAVSLIRSVFGKDILEHPYQNLFHEAVTEPESEEMKRINDFLQIYVKSWNDGTLLNIEATAHSVGLDPAIAREVVASITKKFEENERRRGKH